MGGGRGGDRGRRVYWLDHRTKDRQTIALVLSTSDIELGTAEIDYALIEIF